MLTQWRLIELQNSLNTGVGFSIFYASGAEAKAMVDELIDQRADRVKLQGEIERLTHELAEAHATRPLPPSPRYGTDPDRLVAIVSEQHGRVAIDIEALAQRLAKVEDRLPVIEGALRGQMISFEKMGRRLDGLNQHKRVFTLERQIAEAATDARLDQVCEIIGTRIGGLEDLLKSVSRRADRLGDRVFSLEQAPERFVLRDNVKVTDAPLPFGLQPNPPGFPTGAGTTVEDTIAQVEEPSNAEFKRWQASSYWDSFGEWQALTEKEKLNIEAGKGLLGPDAIAQVEEPGAESEPLKPQRGDRVRLEGAIAFYGHDTLPDGWYDVLGHDAVTAAFQIKAATGALRWVEGGTGLKEVRRGAANLPE